jgi:FkbH-like protein
MTQKTNQFNLTTRRYQLADIKALLDSPETFVYVLRYADRFGDAGLVALAIVRTHLKDWLIDSLLLSCRVIGRTVEQALLVCLARKARQSGAQRLIGEYIPTAKNALVQDFYPSQGFTQITTNDGPIQFQANLDKWPSDFADYLQAKEY